MFDKVFFLKYISSFSDGRVRIRHNSLKQADVIKEIDAELKRVKGIQSVEFNPRTGSMLVLYDSNVLPTDKFIEVALPWAEKLEQSQREKLLAEQINKSIKDVKANDDDCPVCPTKSLGEYKGSTQKNPQKGACVCTPFGVASKPYNAALLGTFVLSTVGLFSRRLMFMHKAAGLAFILLCLPHIYKYKKRIPPLDQLP